MKVFAPGKLILSGEHAAVYGKPALAMAVNRYAVSSVTSHFLPFIFFDLCDLSYKEHLSFPALRNIKNKIKNKHDSFLQGDFKIKDVLQKPMELTQFALMLFFEMLNVKLNEGVQIQVQSTIPMGCGMGSSAATILSILNGVANYLKITLQPELLFQLGLEAENMQHGTSSGLDIRISQQGGCIYVNEGEMASRPIPSIPMFLINTGKPITTTGECVSFAATYFKESSIGNDFAAVTNALDGALQNNHLKHIQQALSGNHELLVKIGVVPEKVQSFVCKLEESHAAAKICGAGAVAGDNAGVVLAVTEDESYLKKLCDNFQYQILPIQADSKGVHFV